VRVEPCSITRSSGRKVAVPDWSRGGRRARREVRAPGARPESGRGSCSSSMRPHPSTWRILGDMLESRGLKLVDRFSDKIHDRLLPPKRCGHEGLIRKRSSVRSRGSKRPDRRGLRCDSARGEFSNRPSCDVPHPSFFPSSFGVVRVPPCVCPVAAISLAISRCALRSASV